VSLAEGAINFSVVEAVPAGTQSDDKDDDVHSEPTVGDLVKFEPTCAFSTDVFECDVGISCDDGGDDGADNRGVEGDDDAVEDGTGSVCVPTCVASLASL